MKKPNADPMINAIYQHLEVDTFITYDKAWPFISRLEKLSNKINQIMAQDPSRAAKLYEVFLAGTYDKVEEIDDSSGNLAMFFEELFLQWITARQQAKNNPKDIIADIFAWQQHDDYGFMYEIEKSVAKILNRASLGLYKTHFDGALNQAYQASDIEDPTVIFDYPYKVRRNAQALKDIFIAKKDTKSYLALSKKFLLSPKDCEVLCEIYTSKRQYESALEMIEQGAKLEKSRQWANESSSLLAYRKKEVLGKLGRTDQALTIAWTDFKCSPSAYSYEDLMSYVEKSDHQVWHEKAMKAAGKHLSGYIEICILTKEWQRLAEKALSEKDDALSDISHYTTEPAAKALEKKFPSASAKLYTSMGNRIVDAKKSKYYPAAIKNFKMARKLWLQVNEEHLWDNVVKAINAKHFRKYSFIHDFNDIAKGKPEKKTLAEQKKDRILNYSKDNFFKKENA